MKVNQFFCGWLWPRHLDWERSQYRLDVLRVAEFYPRRPCTQPLCAPHLAPYEPKHLEEA